MKICVLLPDYSTSDVDYQFYDPARNIASLLPNDIVDTIFLNKLSTYKQLKEASKNGYDIYVNLCEGYLDWTVPSIDVIYSLDLLNLPYTGPNKNLYDPTKELMKYVAFCANVATPPFKIIKKISDINDIHLDFPLFIKPAKAGDSLGIDKNSLVNDIDELKKQAKKIITQYDELIVEEYIDGREFTVLVSKNANTYTCESYTPVEFIFPENYNFKTYSLKTSELHPKANIPVTDIELKERLCNAAKDIFIAFNGVGYARLDFRMNKSGKIFFLEINFTCSVFYKDGFEGSADYILKYDKRGQTGFLKNIIEEGIARHKNKQKCYALKGNSIDGYGIFATKNIAANEIIFKGEEKAQRIVSKKYVEKNWNQQQQDDFARYAYPISKNIFILWDDDANEWAPQNHSCNANTAYDGLNVVAIKSIKKDEELTINYSYLINNTAQSFVCKCGEPNCVGVVIGDKDNNIEQKLNIET